MTGTYDTSCLRQFDQLLLVSAAHSKGRNRKEEKIVLDQGCRCCVRCCCCWLVYVRVSSSDGVVDAVDKTTFDMMAERLGARVQYTRLKV